MSSSCAAVRLQALQCLNQDQNRSIKVGLLLGAGAARDACAAWKAMRTQRALACLPVPSYPPSEHHHCLPK